MSTREKARLVPIAFLACGLMILMASSASAGLLAHYAFDGDATDSSGNANNAVLNGGVGFTAAGGGFTGNAGDFAVNFANAGEAVTAPAAAFQTMSTNNAASVSLWMFGDASQPRNDTSFSFNQGGTRQFQAHAPWSDGVVYFDTGGGATAPGQRVTYDSLSSEEEGQWNHYLFVKNGNDKQLWINGIQRINQVGTATSGIGAFDTAVIGAETAAGGNNYRGLVDDFGIWDRGLNAAEAQALYNLAVESELQYGVTDANSLFELFDAGTGQVEIDGLIWLNADNLLGSAGDVLALGGGRFAVVLDANGNGLQASLVPEPKSIVAFLVAFAFLAFVTRRRRSK